MIFTNVNPAIKNITDLKKCTISIYKDGDRIMAIFFNKVSCDKLIGIQFFMDDSYPVILSSSLFKHNLEFQFANENFKFYRIDI